MESLYKVEIIAQCDAIVYYIIRHEAKAAYSQKLIQLQNILC